MYNTELNKIYTNKDFQKMLQQFALECEAANIRVTLRHPYDTKLRDSWESTPIPSIVYMSQGIDNQKIFSEFIQQYYNLVDDVYEPGNCFLVNNASDTDLRNGVSLWV